MVWSSTRIHFSHVSSFRIHHLGSQVPQQLYYNCLLWSHGNYSCSFKGIQHNTYHFPIVSKME